MRDLTMQDLTMAEQIARGEKCTSSNLLKVACSGPGESRAAISQLRVSYSTTIYTNCTSHSVNKYIHHN